MARLYQKIDGEAVPLGGGGGSSVDIDNITITKNSSSNKIQVADAITSKVNELNNTASDAGKFLTANGDGTASWENGYVEGFYGTTAVWNALSYAQQKEWIQKNPKVTFTDDYVSNIKQTVSGCMSSIDENDVVGASALKEALTFSTGPVECGKWFGKTKYRMCVEGTIPSTSGTFPVIPLPNVNVCHLSGLGSLSNRASWYPLVAYKIADALQYCRIFYEVDTGVMLDNKSDVFYGGGYRIMFEYTLAD